MTRTQLLAMGMAPSSIDWRLRMGRLFKVHWGVYSVGTPPITPLDRAMAAVLACGEGAVLSHGSALALWGIWKRWETPFEVITKADRRPPGVKAHRSKLHPRDVTRHVGIPVTTLERTLLDQARGMSQKALTRAVNTGRHERHLRLEAVGEVINRHPTHRGRAALAYCIGIASTRPTRSSFEDEFPAFCERYGLPKPELNVIVAGREVDALFRDEKVIVELDSWEFHSSRNSFEGDRDRDVEALAAGFVTIRITWERHDHDPDREAARLNAILAQRRRRAA